MNAHEFMEKFNLSPPIGIVPCRLCGAPSSFQNVEGGWCHLHWPESRTMQGPKT